LKLSQVALTWGSGNTRPSGVMSSALHLTGTPPVSGHPLPAEGALKDVAGTAIASSRAPTHAESRLRDLMRTPSGERNLAISSGFSDRPMRTSVQMH
jgi:hypothetical protein